MSVVLYALGAGLICWGGYMLLAGDSFAALDIAANLAGWGVFAIGLGAVVGALVRLAKALEFSSRPRRMARPAGGVMAPLRGETSEPRLRPAASAPAARQPAAPRPEPIPSFEPAPRMEPSARAEPRVGFERAPVFAPQPRVEPIVAEREPEAVFEPEPEPAPEPAAVTVEPEAPAPEERSAEASEPSTMETDGSEDDAPEPGLSKRERRQRRREQKARQEAEAESFERPEVVAPQLGGGRRMFAGPEGDRRSPERPAPVSPPLERAARPAASRVTEPEPEPETEELKQADPASVGLASTEPVTPEAPRPEPEARETKAPEAKPADPKVPDWLARARARREARAGGEQPPVAPEVVVPVEEPAPHSIEASEPEEPAEIEIRGSESEAAHVVAPSMSDQAVAEEPLAPEEPAVETAAAEGERPAGPTLVREGEHRGVTYRFYDDGSVEAHSPHGVRRFATVDELRATVIAARGPAYVEQEPEPQERQKEEPAPDAPSQAAEPEVPAHHDDPLEAALSELEGGDDRDRPAKKA